MGYLVDSIFQSDVLQYGKLANTLEIVSTRSRGHVGWGKFARKRPLIKVFPRRRPLAQCWGNGRMLAAECAKQLDLL